MPLSLQLRALGASTVALAVAASAGLALSFGPSSDLTPAIPAATPDAAAAALADREGLTNSRAAEREALATTLADAAQLRSAALESTTQAITDTELAIQEQREAERAAAERAAAEQAAAEEAAAEEARRLGYTPGAKPKEIARQMAQNIYGWGSDQFTCYDNIIMRESEWIVTADNPTSSAYGIPQALPGKRMASEGADWETNPATQIKWGLKYVKERYGTPCKAWSFKRANGWY